MTSMIPCQNSQEPEEFARHYPLDKEEAKGSCLVLPGSKRRTERKLEEQRVSLLEEESPTSTSTRLTAWTTSTADTEEISDLFPHDPFGKEASKNKTLDAKQPAPRGRDEQPVVVTPESLLKAPDPSERRRRKSYEGEREPDGVRGQEAQVAPPESLLQTPRPTDRRRRKSYEGEQEPEGVRGQEAHVSRVRRSSNSPTNGDDEDDDGPTMRSFSEAAPRSSSSSLRLVPPASKQQAPPHRQPSRRRESRTKKKQQQQDDPRSPRLELLPVSETSIPEGEEEESSDGESYQGKKSTTRALFTPDDGEEDKPSQVGQDFHTNRDIRKYRQGSELSNSVSPPTPRRRQPSVENGGVPSLLGRPQVASKSSSSDDLEEMMPDLVPNPSYSHMTGRSSRSNGRSTAKVLATAELESPSNDTNDANYINKLKNVERLNASAVEYVEHGEYDMALAAFEKVLAAYKEMNGDTHPLVASTYHNLGMVHSKRAALLLDGTFHQNHCRQQSLECFQAAARTGRDSLGPNHPNVAVSLVRIGFLLLQARQYQNAFVTFKEALRIRLEHYGKDVPHSLVANLYNNLGVCKMHMGQYKEGSSLLKTALEIQRKVLRGKRQEKSVSRSELRNCLLEIADTLCNLGGLFLEWIRQQGPDPRNADEVVAAFAEALEIRTTVLGPKHELVHQVRTLHEMARTTPLPAPLDDKESQEPNPPTTNSTSSSRSRSASHSDTGPYSRSRSRSRSASRSDTGSNSRSRSRSRSASRSDTGTSGSHSLSRAQEQNMADAGFSRREGGSEQFSLEESTEVDTIFAQHSSASDVSANAVTNQMPSNVQLSRKESFVPPPPEPILSGSPKVSGDEDTAHPQRSTVKDDSRRPIDDARLTRDRIAQVSGDTQVRVAPHYIPRTAAPLQANADGAGDFEELDRRTSLRHKARVSDSPGELVQGASETSSYFAEESCLMGTAGGGSERGATLFLALLIGDDGFHADKSRALSSHEIMVVQPMSEEGPGSPIQQRSKQMGSMASFSRSLAQQRRGSKGAGSLEYASPAQSPNSTNSPHPLSSIADNGDNSLAPLNGDWGSSRRSFGKALTKEILDNPEDNLDKIYDAASRYFKRNQHREALHLFRIILDSQKCLKGELHPDVGAAWYNVGVALLRSERHGKALEAFERSVRVRRSSLGKDHPEVAMSLVKVGITQLLLNNFEMTLLSFQEALTVRRNSLGELHPSTARAYNNIGCVHMEFNELSDARRSFEAALDIQRNALSTEPTNGPSLFSAATTLCNLGYLYRVREMPERAVLVLKEALAMQEHLLGPRHPTTMTTLESLADVTAKSKDGTKALKFYEELLLRYRTVLKWEVESRKQSGTESVLLFKMSLVHRNQKDFAKELSTLQHALTVIRKMDGSTMTNDEREENDRLGLLISDEIHRCKKELQQSDEFNWL